MSTDQPTPLTPDLYARIHDLPRPDPRGRLHAMFNLSEADEAEFDSRVDAVVAAETATLQARIDELVGQRDNLPAEPATPAYRSSVLPPRDALCSSCGHTGLDHHHDETHCWATLPRTRQRNGAWSAVATCACAQFEASS